VKKRDWLKEIFFVLIVSVLVGDGLLVLMLVLIGLCKAVAR
jgi:hypothetical protein